LEHWVFFYFDIASCFGFRAANLLPESLAGFALSREFADFVAAPPR
jgi:hypothetical protein